MSQRPVGVRSSGRLAVDVADVAPPGVAHLAAEVLAPAADHDRSGAALVCVPGGGMSRRYFDLQVAGDDGTYSMARHLAGAGHVVITLDHPGVGESDRPDDGYRLDPATVADVDGAAVERLLAGLGDGSLVEGLGPIEPDLVVGCGHSMGALLTVHRHARGHRADALALLGFSGAGLPAMLTAAEAEVADDPARAAAALAGLVHARFGRPLSEGATGTSAFLVAVEVPDAALAAIAEAGTTQLNLCGLWSMIPGASAAELAAVDVPTFLGLGAHDIAGDPWAIPANLPGCTDLTLFVCPDSGHNHNVAPTRARLWDRLDRWVRSLLAAPGGAGAGRSEPGSADA